MRDDRVYLEHVLDSAERIRRFIAAGRDAFFADDMAQDAVVRNLEIIGEATKRLSEVIGISAHTVTSARNEKGVCCAHPPARSRVSRSS